MVEPHQAPCLLALTHPEQVYFPLPPAEIALNVHLMFVTVVQLLIVTWMLLRRA